MLKQDKHKRNQAEPVKWTRALAITAVAWMMVGCGQVATTSNAGSPSNTTTPAANASGTANTSAKQTNSGPLSVLYAGSMTNVMERKIGPDVKQQLGITFQGEGKGSTALAQMIASKISTPDVFISASPSADKLLMGAANHNLVSWYLTLATDQLVIAYSPKSRFAGDLKAAAAGQKPWYTVMEQPGFRLGRTDPVLDPKGADTIMMAELAASYYHQPQLQQQLLGANENSKQVFPEETLLSQLTTGQMDAIVAYKHEAVEWGVPYITLPSAINLGKTADAKAYAKATYTDPKGKVKHGSPIEFTITIPTTEKHTGSASTFIKYMVQGAGHDILIKDGFVGVQTALVGNASDLPGTLSGLVTNKVKKGG